MRTLRTVQPHGLLVVDHDGEDGNLVLGGAGSGRLERRVDDRAVAALELNAGVVKVGLGDCVIAGPELELDHGAGLGLDVLWPELEAGRVVDGVAADRDDLDVDGYSGRNGVSNQNNELQACGGQVPWAAPRRAARVATVYFMMSDEVCVL